MKAVLVRGGAYCSHEIVWCMVQRVWKNMAAVEQCQDNPLIVLFSSLCKGKLGRGSWPAWPLCGPLICSIFKPITN